MKHSFLTTALLALLACSALGACGGGTSGTGMNAYEGRVTDTSGAPVQGAVLTVESTGDSAVTDSNGDFLVQSTASGPEVVILAETADFSGHVTVRNVIAEHSRVRVNVTIDAVRQRASTTDFNARAQFVGLCDYYFENREIIRQANRVPKGTVCTLKIDLLADGERLDGAAVALQSATCERDAVWQTIQAAETGSEGPGEAKISFKYVSSREYCRYRVVMPYHFGNAWPIYYPIDTFAEQAAHPNASASK